MTPAGRAVATASMNIGVLRNHLSQALARVARGEEVVICRRSVPVARIVRVGAEPRNRTVLGCEPGSVTVLGGLTEPAIPSSDWGVLEAAER